MEVLIHSQPDLPDEYDHLRQMSAEAHLWATLSSFWVFFSQQ